MRVEEEKGNEQAKGVETIASGGGGEASNSSSEETIMEVEVVDEIAQMKLEAKDKIAFLY